ncbi:uncharacterized protein LOC115621216 [Scaptodrosophila lebanonensis]|uniref:Uncharacterized protein LOC115621216 n=1 Tax=Drosophila lebanonensis TaxID=7225 RepID=A0A6J2T3T8_DROLE|nr:uncharacterized protein LOC115621216 [Scaptodrosophila lebanonensis]
MEYLSYLQNSENDNVTIAEAHDLLKKLVSLIHAESSKTELSSINQATLNAGFRIYYHIQEKFELPDDFADLPQQLTEPNAFLQLFAVLLTSQHARLDAELLETKCVEAILRALQQNSLSLVPVLKATSQLVQKFPKLKLQPLKLEHFYHCLQLQSQTGSREETLTLFSHCCKQRDRAFFYFRVIVEFWPWTNRNKYYLLSGILKSHSLADLLAVSGQSESEFFAGLRLSLSYKGLLAASQYPVKSLSSQSSSGLLALAADLLSNGSVAEIQNFYSQWFLRIKQRDELFMLVAKPEIVEFLQNTDATRGIDEQYRLILIFSMFAKEIYAVSKLHFFKISTELLTNCSSFETDAQLLIFKFLVNNLPNFAVEDCLEFFYNFIERHRSVESSEFRNTLLGKMPTIINHTAKHFNKAVKGRDSAGSDALAHNIERFFRQLQLLVEQDVQSDLYQPKIFALKMLDILNKSLYAENVSKNAKMCSTEQNKQLGRFLLDQKVFQPELVAAQLFKLLLDPQGFDDALELNVELLLQLGHVNTDDCVDRLLTLCASHEVDECALATFYAQLAVRNFNKEQASALYDKCFNDLSAKLNDFAKDPLQTAKTSSGHLFGHLCVLEHLVSSGYDVHLPGSELLTLLERILNLVLDFLNVANARKAEEAPAIGTVASFQDMDESLQLLVQESSYKTLPEEAEEYRKYLLLSFWLTLKGCCDLATSVGCTLLWQAGASNAVPLQRCLQINVAVLTRCRHKGAIEAAGLSIGKLTRAITNGVSSDASAIQMLHDCLESELLSGRRQVSTTRRGAGFSIMFLHVVKNENPHDRRLLKRVMELILHRLNSNQAFIGSDESSFNLDRWEALMLHYLCVLVRDTELRVAMSKYYNEIMLLAMAHIEHTEWTISNAALQLFGALVPKLVGQRQATQFDTRPPWEPSELNYEELSCLLPKACEHMLRYCNERQATSSIILFLGFLSKVEHLRMSAQSQGVKEQLLSRFRKLSWKHLQHKCEEVRQLAATCFVRAHEFRCDLPAALLNIAKLAAQVTDDNFYEGLIYTLHAGVLKLEHEARHVWPATRLSSFKEQLLVALRVTQDGIKHLKDYTLRVLLELLELLQAEKELEIVHQVLSSSNLEAEEHAMQAITIK